MDYQPQPLILIVDDDDSIRMLLKMAIKNKGYQIEEATNGEEAIAVYQRCQPDLVILDAIMPIMDGFQTCTNICTINQKNNQETPILMLTFLDDQESINKAFSAGATDYITKPIHWAVLFQRVKRLLIASNNSLNVQKIQTELSQFQNYETIFSLIINQDQPVSQDLLEKIRLFFKAEITIFFDGQNNSIYQSSVDNISSLKLEDIKAIILTDDYQTEYQARKIITINSIKVANLHADSLSILNKFNITSCTIAPIINKNKVISLLGLYRVNPENSWQKEELRRLTDLTHLLSLKNHN